MLDESICKQIKMKQHITEVDEIKLVSTSLWMIKVTDKKEVPGIDAINI